MMLKKYLLCICSMLVISSVNAEVANEVKEKEMGVIVGQPIANSYDKIEMKKDYKKVDNTITISKIRVEIPKGKKSDFLTVYNKSSNEEFGFTVQMVKWSQDTGKDQIVTTDNVLVAPKTFVIKPQEYKNIRIIAKDYEKAVKDYSYRLVLTQITRKAINLTQEDPNKLKVNLNMTIPVIFYSENFKEADKLNIDLGLDKERKYLTIENKDKQHILISKILINDIEYPYGWYVLPGITVKKKLSDVPAATKYKIELKTDRESFVKELILN